MKNLVFVVISMGLAALASCNLAEKNQVPELQASTDQQTLIERGKYLVTAAGCHDCHSPKVFGPHGPEPDPERLLSGHPSDMSVPKIDTAILKSWVLFGQDLTVAVGPWGASFAANLTSDPTGIGNWSETQFFKAIREGKYKGLDGGRMLLPPMPWPNVAQLSDEDLRSIFAYLKSTKPVKNVVPAPIPPTDLVNLSM
jgi:hypothetical protein